MRPTVELHGYHLFRPSAWILTEGEDAHDFLQSQFSNDLSGLELGEVSYGLWLDQKGKVHGDSFVFRKDEEAFILMSYATEEETILDKLNSFIVADDVELEGSAAGIFGLSLVGNALKTYQTMGYSTDKSGVFYLGNESFYAIPGRRGTQPSVELVSSEQCRELLVSRMVEGAPEMEVLDENSMEALRIVSVCPQIPLDLGPGELPQEGGLEKDAVSFTKGCYLGQEVMSRLHSMGQARRSLRLTQASKPVEYGSPVFIDGKKKGMLKTSTHYKGSFFALVLINNSVPVNSQLIAGNLDNGVTLDLIS